MTDVLAVEGLTVRLTAHPDRSSILDDVSFSVAAGEVLGIVGEFWQRQEHARFVGDGIVAAGADHSGRAHRRAG